MKELLQESKNRLLQPLAKTRRTYLIIFNLINALLTLNFMIIGRVALGSPVVARPLVFLYTTSIIVSLITALYNIIKPHSGNFSSKYDLLNCIINNQIIDNILSKSSIVFILLMSVGGITGYGNHSSDALLTNFAFAHSMIVAIVIIIGRKVALVWGIFVLFALFFNMFSLGWDYEYHYQTPTEVKAYKLALEKGEKSALERKSELEKFNLNPPSAVRYFRLWFTFILVSLLLAWTFGGIIIKTYEVIPSVVGNIETAIQDSTKIETEIAKYTVRILHHNEIIIQLEDEIGKLDIKDKKNLRGILNSIRQSSASNEEDWLNFKVNFDIVHGNFFKYLEKNYPDLSKNEMKLMAYIRLKFTNNEIAKLLDVEMESLKTLRHRLKKKLNLSKGEDLYQFVFQIKSV